MPRNELLGVLLPALGRGDWQGMDQSIHQLDSLATCVPRSRLESRMSPLQPRFPTEAELVHILMDVLVGRHSAFGLAGLSADRLTASRTSGRMQLLVT